MISEHNYYFSLNIYKGVRITQHCFIIMPKIASVRYIPKIYWAATTNIENNNTKLSYYLDPIGM